jgi:CRP-like cAMP-binding protein
VELAGSAQPTADGVIEVKSPLTQQELADWIGVSRDAVVLAMRRIRELGWVETGRRTIRILDLNALKAASVE